MRSIIVEDIPDAIELLRRMLKEECPQVELVGEAQDLDIARNLIRRERPELVFLDIQMKNATAFDLLRELKANDELDFSIIFVTGLSDSDNMAKAFDFSALHYITKPVDREKLRLAVEKAFQRKHNREQLQRQLEVLLESAGRRMKSLTVPLVRNVMEIVRLENIVYLQTDREVTKIHLQSGGTLTAVEHLGYFKNILTPDYDFFPVSQSLLVNVDFVKKYDHSDLTVYLLNNQALLASRRGGHDFRLFLSNRHKHLLHEGTGLMERLKKLLR